MKVSEAIYYFCLFALIPITAVNNFVDGINISAYFSISLLAVAVFIRLYQDRKSQIKEWKIFFSDSALIRMDKFSMGIFIFIIICAVAEWLKILNFDYYKLPFDFMLICGLIIYIFTGTQKLIKKRRS